MKGVTMGRKRKSHTAALKAQVALAAVRGDKTVSGLTSLFGVHPTLIHAWKKQLVSQAAVVGARRGAQGLSVPAPQRDHRAGQPGVEHGYHVYSDAGEVHVPDGGDRLAQPLRAVVAAVEHAGGGVLPGGLERGLEPEL